MYPMVREHVHILATSSLGISIVQRCGAANFIAGASGGAGSLARALMATVLQLCLLRNR